MSRIRIAVSLWLFASAAYAATPAFIAPDGFAIDGTAQSIVIADFDENGKPDLAVGAEQVFILLADGSGSFQPALIFESGVQSGAVTAADFDADGHLDVAAVNGSGAVTILAGAGDGTFTATQTIAVAAMPYAIRSANFNGDTLLDLIVVSKDPDTELQTITVLAGEAGGGFTQTALLDGGSFDLGDFNGDANLDVLAAVADPTGLRLFLGNGDGTFTDAGFRDIVAPPNAGYRNFVVAADFNQDGNLDVIAPQNGEQPPLALLFGDGSGGFGTPTAIATGTTITHAIAHDLDQDGDLDLVISSAEEEHVTVLEGNGDGSFGTAVHYAASFDPSFMAAADLDADGNADVVVTNPTAYGITLLRGDGAGGFSNSVRRPELSGATWIATSDLDGDAHLDLALPAGGTMVLLFGDGLGNFDRRTDIAVGGMLRCVAIADLNQDGHLDLAASMLPAGPFDPRGIVLLFGDGSGAFAVPVLLPTAQMQGRATVVAADFNLDGKPDLAVTNIDASFVRGVQIFLNTGGGTFAAPVHYAHAPQVNHFIATDLTNDGVPDLVLGNVAPGYSLSIFAGAGDGTFSSPSTIPLGGFSLNHVAAGDLDTDGNIDLVVGAQANGVNVLFGHGDGSFDPGLIFSTGSGGTVEIADFDQDGKADIAATSTGESGLSILLGDGARNFSQAMLYPAGQFPNWMTVGDFREDNRVDVAVVASRQLALLLNVTGGENTPAATNVIVQPVDTTTGTSPVTITFDRVVGAGTTTLTTSSTGPAPPSGFQLGVPPVYFDLRTTASFQDNVRVCIHYSALGFTDESQLTLWHYEGGQWRDVTTSLNTTTDVVCGNVTSFSPFAVFAPQASSCTITTTLDAAKVRLGLAGSASAGMRLDVLAEVFRNGTLAGSGQIDSVAFQNDRLVTIPLQNLVPLGTCPGDQLAFRVSARNACSGSERSAGIARLRYNDPSASGYFRTASDQKFYLLDGFLLGTAHPKGPERTIDAAMGAPCHPFVSFSTWRLTMPP